MPESHAWDTFGAVAGVIIFLGGLAFALQRLGIIGKRASPAPGNAQPPTPAPVAAGRPSAEAIALIDATRALVAGVQATTERTEATGRVHMRLDDLERDLSDVKAQNAELKGQLAQANGTLRLIEEHLLNKK